MGRRESPGEATRPGDRAPKDTMQHFLLVELFISFLIVKKINVYLYLKYQNHFVNYYYYFLV